METFSALLAICAGNSPVPGEFPTQRPVTRSFDVYFDLHTNKRLSKQLWGWWFEAQSRPFRRHRNGVQVRIFRSIRREHSAQMQSTPPRVIDQYKMQNKFTLKLKRNIIVLHMLNFLNFLLLCLLVLTTGLQAYLNPLVPGRCGDNFKSLIFKLIMQNERLGAGCEIDFGWMSDCEWEDNIGSGKGLVSSGNKLSHEPVLTRFFVAIWRH